MRIKHLSGRESSVTTFLLECYVKASPPDPHSHPHALD